jgi:hypothetical protein
MNLDHQKIQPFPIGLHYGTDAALQFGTIIFSGFLSKKEKLKLGIVLEIFKGNTVHCMGLKGGFFFQVLRSQSRLISLAGAGAESKVTNV